MDIERPPGTQWRRPTLAVGIALCALALPSLAAARQPPATWKIHEVKVSPAGDGRGVSVVLDAVVLAPASAVEQVVGDVSLYPNWIPGFRAVRPVGEGGGDEHLFETDVDLPWPLAAIRERIGMKREEVRGGTRYSWVQVSGDLRRNEGSWTVTALPGGRTRVIYRANFQLRSWVPMFLIRLAQRREAPAVIRNLQERTRFYS